MMGKPAERHGSMVIVSPSWNLRMWSWQVALSEGRGVVAVDVERAHAADTLTAIVIEEDRLAAFVDKLLVKYVEHLEERAALRDVLQLVGFKGALLFRSFLAPDFQCYIDILIHDSVVFE